MRNKRKLTALGKYAKKKPKAKGQSFEITAQGKAEERAKARAHSRNVERKGTTEDGLTSNTSAHKHTIHVTGADGTIYKTRFQPKVKRFYKRFGKL